MRQSTIENTTTLIITALVILAIGGWIANVVKLFGADGFGGTEIARAFGILIAPLGAILGFL